MAKRKNEDLDLDDDFHDDAYGDDMDFGDFDYDPVPKKRHAVIRFAGAAVGTTAKTALGHESRRRYLHQAMPEGYGLAYDTAADTLSDVGELYDIVQDKGLGPLKKSLKRTMRSVLTTFGAKRGEGLRGKLLDWAQDEERYNENVDPDDAEMRMAMGEIFGQQQDTQEAIHGLKEQLAEGQTEQTTALSAQNMQMGGMVQQLSQIARSTERLASYQDQITINFQRRSLELQYRHFFVARKHMEIQNQTFDLLKGGIETISHNTALPDIVKQTKSEQAMNMLREQAFSSIVTGAANTLGNVRKKIFARGKQKLGDFFRDFGSTSSQVLEGLGTMAEMASGPDAQVDPVELAGESAGGWLGKQITELAIKLTGNKFKDKETLAARGLSLKRGVNNMDFMFNKIFSTRHDTGIGWLENLKNFLGPGLTTQENLLVRDNQYKSLDKQTAFDTLTKRTITDVIPAFLSSINAELWRIRNKTNAGGEMVWSFEDSKLITQTEMETYAYDKVFKGSGTKSRIEAAAALLKHADPNGDLTDRESKALLAYFDLMARKGLPVDWLKLAAGKESQLKADSSTAGRIAQHLTVRFDFTPEQLRRVEDPKYSLTDATHGNSLKQQKALDEADDHFRRLNTYAGAENLRIVEQMAYSGQLSTMTKLGVVKKEGDQFIVNYDALGEYYANEAYTQRDNERTFDSKKVEERRKAYTEELRKSQPGMSERQIEDEVNHQLQRDQESEKERKEKRTLFNAVDKYANKWTKGWFAKNDVNMDNVGEKTGDFLLHIFKRGNDFLKDNGVDVSKFSKEKREEAQKRWKQLQDDALAAEASGDPALHQQALSRIDKFLNEAKRWGNDGRTTTVSQHHTGGLAGHATARRKVDSSRFKHAPRYHTGGKAGFAANDPMFQDAANDDLKDDEVPAVLRQGEEVLTSHDPRHRDNILKSLKGLLGRFGVNRLGKIKSAARSLLPKGVTPKPHAQASTGGADAFVGPIQKSPHEQIMDAINRIADIQTMTYEIIQQRAAYWGMPEGFFRRWKRRIGTTARDGYALVSGKLKRAGEVLRDTPRRLDEKFKSAKAKADAFLSRKFGRVWTGTKKVGKWIGRQYDKVKGGFMSAKEWVKLSWEQKKEKLREFLVKMKVKFTEAQFEALIALAKAQDWLGEKVPSWKTIKEGLKEVGIRVAFFGAIGTAIGASFVGRTYRGLKEGVGKVYDKAKDLLLSPIHSRNAWKKMETSEREKVLWAYAKAAGVQDNHSNMNKVYTIAAYQDWLSETPPRQKDVIKSLTEAGFKVKAPMGWFKKLASGAIAFGAGVVGFGVGIVSRIFGAVKMPEFVKKGWQMLKDVSGPICSTEVWEKFSPPQRAHFLWKFAMAAGVQDSSENMNKVTDHAIAVEWCGNTPPATKAVLEGLRSLGYTVKNPQGFFKRIWGVLSRPGQLLTRMTGGIGQTVARWSSKLKSLGEQWDNKFNGLNDPICAEGEWKPLNATQRKALILKWVQSTGAKITKEQRRAALTEITKAGLAGDEVPLGIQVRDALAPIGIVIKSRPKGFRGHLAQVLKAPGKIVGSILKGAIAAPVAVAKAAWKMTTKAASFIGGLFKFRSFSMAAMNADVQSITNEVEGLRKVYQAVLMVYNAVSKPYQPQKKVRKSLLDSNGDGVRDGSVEDQQRKKSKMAQWLADKKAAAGEKLGKAKGWVGDKAKAAGKGLMDMLSKVPKSALIGGALATWLGSKFFKKDDGTVDVGKTATAGVAGAALGPLAAWGMKKALWAGGRWALTAALPMALEAGGAALAGLGAVLTAPVTLAIGATALVLGGAYLLYKHLSKEKSPVITLRMAQYGFKMSEGKYVEPILNLERDLLKNGVTVTDKGATIKSGRDPKEYLKLFGVDETNQEQLKEWVQWFHYRFKPVFLSHMVALKKHAKSGELHKADSLMGRTEKLAYLKDVHYTRAKGSPYDVKTHPFASEPWFGGLLDKGDVDDAYSDAVSRAESEKEKTGAATAEDKKETDKEAKKKQEQKGKTEEQKKADEQKKDEGSSSSWNWKRFVPVLNTWELAKDAWNNRKAIYDGAVDLASRGIGAVADAAGQVADGARDVASRASQAVVTGTGSGWSKNMRPDLFSDIAEASRRHGVPESYMRTMAWIESKGDPNAKAKGSSASGIYQFIDSTAKRYGIQGQQFDQKMNVDAGARLALDNMKYLRRKLGRNPEPYELYLAHQQGMGGAVKLLTNPNAPAVSVVGMQAVVNNGGQANMTAGQFADKWRKSYEAAAKKAGVSMTAGERVDAVTGGAVSAAKDAASAAGNAVSNAASSAASAVSGAAKSATGAVSNAVAATAEAAKGAYNQAVDTTSRAMETVGNAASDLGKFLSNLPADLIALGKRVLKKVSGSVNIDGLHSGFKNALYAMCGEYHKATGKTLMVTSGFRTREQQEKLWAAYKAGRGAPAARPGRSLHESGLAVDIDNASTGGADAVDRMGIAAKYGFFRPFKNAPGKKKELWHFENHYYARGKTTVISQPTPAEQAKAKAQPESAAPAKGGASGSGGGGGTPAPAKAASPTATPAATAPKPSVTPTVSSPQATAISDAVPKTQMTEQQARQAMDTQSLKIMTAMAASMSSIDQKMTDLIAAVKNGNAGKSEPDAKTAPSKDTVEKPPSKAQTGRQMLEHVDAPINMLLS